MTGAPRLLVLGAGRHQTPLIRRAEARGITTVAVDYHENSPGKRVATHPVLADALDRTGVTNAARHFAVDGIITVGTDQPVLVMAQVADELGLPCHISPRGALCATNKAAMRPALVGAGVPMSPARRIGPQDDPAVMEFAEFPYVVKAADSQGQRGMSVVSSPVDMERAVAAARAVSRSATVMVEEFVDGPEVTINAWIADGEPILLALLDRITFNPPPALGICLQHVFPSVHTNRVDEAEAIARGVARAYGVRRGPLYIQAIVGPNGLSVIEAASRVGGGHEAQLLPRVRHFDLLDRTIDLALGRPEAPVLSHAVASSGAVNFVVARPGTVTAFEPIENCVAEGLIDEGSWYVEPGHVQPEISDSMGRIGYFIVTAADRDLTLERASKAYARLRALDESGNNLVFWPDPAVMNTAPSRGG